MKNCNCDFDHQLTFIEKVDGGEKFKVSIRISHKLGWIEGVKFIVGPINEKKTILLEFARNEDGFAVFEAEAFLKNWAVQYYYFFFYANGKYKYYKNKNITEDDSVTTAEMFKISVGFKTPEWAKDAVMYHIFVDRYRRSGKYNLVETSNRNLHKNWDEVPILGPDKNGNWNVDFYGGNLKGIEDSLDYIKKLGVTILYLSPIVTSQSNHRYDTADYEIVDSYAGTNECLKDLCDSAHKRNIKVVLDAVFNHTGNDSKYFNEYGSFENLGAYQSPESPYKDFYRYRWYNGELHFDYWWGFKNLPVCDGNSLEWQNYIFGENGIIDQWFVLGIDGLRLDVADELSDYFIEGIRNAVHRNKKDGLILGEVWVNPMRENRTYLSSGKAMDSVMNYQWVDAFIRYYKYTDVNRLKYSISDIITEYPDDTIHTLMNFTSTHDISRAIEIFGRDVFTQNRWSWDLFIEGRPDKDKLKWISEHPINAGEYKYGKKIFKSYSIAIAFMPGIFSIFYGDEVGIKGIGNLMNRAPYPWKKRDKDLLKFFRRLGSCKNLLTFLKNADLNVISIDERVFMYERFFRKQKVLVVVSRTHHETNINLPEKFLNEDAEILIRSSNSNKNKLAPYGYLVIKI